MVISEMSLGTEETKALVRAMETRVETVTLGQRGELSLDIRALTEYSGKGKCAELTFYDQTATKYLKDLKTWAGNGNRSWKVKRDIYNYSHERTEDHVRLTLKQY